MGRLLIGNVAVFTTVFIYFSGVIHAQCPHGFTADSDIEPPCNHPKIQRNRNLAKKTFYEHSRGCKDSGSTCVSKMDLTACSYKVKNLDKNSALYKCVTSEPIFEKTKFYEGSHIDTGLEDWKVEQSTGGKMILCDHQYDACKSVPENNNYDSDCSELVSNCRSALRHLYEMMYGPEGQKRVCNNFARKSIRGFFHDQMSNYIDGSILSEGDIQHNFGLCRWNQYINVLSDATKCDPGSIIAMSGMLGYEACGVRMWKLDFDVKPRVNLARPYPCGPNYGNNEAFHNVTGQRDEAFSDTQLSTNATAMENFFYAINGHSHEPPDGEIEYSAEASAAAHAVGRVTCPPDGVDNENHKVPYKTGFFHRPSSEDMSPEEVYYEALDRISDTQCLDKSKNGQVFPVPPPQGRRLSQQEAEAAGGVNTSPFGEGAKDGETDINPEGGFCSMPTHFLGTVNVGGRHRVPRWTAIFQNSAKVKPEYSSYQSICRRTDVTLYLPYELNRITNGEETLISNPALDKFLDIAFDGVNSIDSAWDSCEVGCIIPIKENKLCGGNGLENFDWTEPMCSRGVIKNKYTCCASNKDCNQAAILKNAMECTNSRMVNCIIPRKSDGAQCSKDDECKRGSCKGGRCCNALALGEECGKCGRAGGSCTECSKGFKFEKHKCIDACACSEGCSVCKGCGNCKTCSDGYYLKDGSCLAKLPAGSECAANNQCTSGACRGGKCCDLGLLASANSNMANAGDASACTSCNSRGLCNACTEGYSLCGHVPTDDGGSGGGYGQCHKTISKKETFFRCGNSDFASTDGYDYCGMANHCPCQKAGCYMGCLIEETCWQNSIAATLTDYKPPFRGSCEDDAAWMLRADDNSFVDKSKEEDYKCDWVAEDPTKRCQHSNKFEGMNADALCRKSCDTNNQCTQSPTPFRPQKHTNAPTSTLPPRVPKCTHLNKKKCKENKVCMFISKPKKKRGCVSKCSLNKKRCKKEKQCQWKKKKCIPKK